MIAPPRALYGMVKQGVRMAHAYRLVPAVWILATAALGADYAKPPVPAEMTFAAGKVVKITETGAVADGTSLASEAIAKAIEQCAAAGGGIVQFPKTEKGGTYLTGPITLKSNITLQIDEGVTLKFSTDRKLYPLVKTRWECTDVMNYSPLIYGYQCQNIRITGKGTLDGQGQTWWTWASGKPAANVLRQYTSDREGKFPLEKRVFGEQVQGLRPCLIEPYESKNVLIENVTVKNSPFWTIHPLYSENIIVRNVTILGTGPNTDGCDPDSCKNVLIEKCVFTTGDDCIAIKSGRDGDGIRRNASCENITIRDCTMKGGHGAVTMGSETSGGIKHVYAENCDVDGPDSAIRLKSTRGRGGGIEDVCIKDMKVTSTRKIAITINMRYTSTAEAAKGETTPVFKDVRIENFTCSSSPQALEVLGLRESSVENVVLKDVTITSRQGAKLEFVKGFSRENVKITVASGEVWTMSDTTEAPTKNP
jgi:polygalacturonase